MTDGIAGRRERLTDAACAMGLLGHGTYEELRGLGIDCDPIDLFRVTSEAPEPRPRCTPEGFEGPGGVSATADSLRGLVSLRPDLALRVAERLCVRGEFERAGIVIDGLMECRDVRPLVFRHAFDLLNVGHVELVESLVFDEAFEAPEWLREALSTVEGLLWSGFRGYRQEAGRAREAQVAIERSLRDSAGDDATVTPLAQAWSLLDLYASWGDPISALDVLPRDVTSTQDRLVCCLWTLRRARQLAALGHLDRARSLLDAGRPLVEERSILGAHLAADRFLCLTLLGEPVDEVELDRVRRASRFVADQHLDLLSLSIDGYGRAALAFVGSPEAGGDLARLAERGAIHPDPLLGASLSIACSAVAYRGHSFYAALNHVRDLPLELGFLGVTDLMCAAYVLEVLCQGAVGEEPCPLGEGALDRPSALGLAPLARAAYGVAQDVCRVMEELDPETLASLFEDGEPSFVAATLTGLVLAGSWEQALALARILPRPWREAARARAGAAGEDRRWPERPGAGRGEGDQGDGARAPVLRPIVPPKLDLRMLGSFEAWIGERRLTEDRWRRKAGKTLVQALIVAPGHTLSRAELCDALWPDRDYLTSRNSLYSVLSSVRTALGCVAESGPSYLVCEEGKVSLNPKLVECDVDVFESRCREVLSHQGDRPWRLSLCRHLGRLYRGGLFVPPQDVRGEFQARRQALESLYVDMLVEAAELSLRAGLAKEALWFANDACDRSDLREDALSCRMRALAADGRGHELDATYRRYCTELSEGLFMAPSVRVRTLYAELRRYVLDATADVADPSIEAFEEALDTVA